MASSVAGPDRDSGLTPTGSRAAGTCMARVATILATAAIVWGWLIAQSPRLLGARLTIHTAAATAPALTALLIAGAVVLIACFPPSICSTSCLPVRHRR